MIPLAERDIESILIADGDLPAGWKAGQIDSLTSTFEHMPTPAQAVQQKIDNPAGQNVGLVIVFLHQSSRDTELAYNFVVTGYRMQPLPDVGEAAMLDPGAKTPLVLVFRRCHATVYIMLGGLEPDPAGMIDTSIITNLASRLDKRLQQVAC